MIGTSIEFSDFVDRIRDKFGLRRRFKIKMKDEDVPDDMITMGDQDDLDVAIQSAKSQAKRQRLDVGKMEVSLSFLRLMSRLLPRASPPALACRSHAISKLSCLTKFLFRFGLLKFRSHYTLFDDFEYKHRELFPRSRYRLRYHSDMAYCFPFFSPFNMTAFETIQGFNCRCLDRLGLSETTTTLQNVFSPSYLSFLYSVFLY